MQHMWHHYDIKIVLQISFFSKQMYLLAGSEDSGHYMIYTLFYYNQAPMSSELNAVLYNSTYNNTLHTLHCEQ